MAFRLVSSKTQKITKAVAESWAAMQRWPGDRGLSLRRYDMHEMSLRRGTFRPPQWAKAICLANNEEYRVNGNHTSHLFASFADEFPGFVATVEVYECDEMTDVGALWATFDNARSSRNASEINSVVAAAMPELAHVKTRVRDCSVHGIALVLSGGISGNMSKTYADEKARVALVDNSEFVAWAGGVVTDTSLCKHMCKGGVLAAMFATYKKCKRDAEEFWTSVRDETGDKPNAPHRQYARWLLTTVANRGPGSRTPASHRADSREFYVRGLHCWNAYRRGDDLKIVKYSAGGPVPTVA